MQVPAPTKVTMALKRLIQSHELEFLMEAHNGLSAKIVEEAGFKGIWASGLSMSAAFGVRDANEASWTQVLEVVEFMTDAVKIPILLDGDTGYGDFNSVRRLVKKLNQRGVAGVCLEDKCFPKTNSFIRGSQQPLASIDEFSGKLKAAKDASPDDDFCVVARVEAFIAGWGLKEALRRAHAYADAGADAILIHSAKSEPSEILSFQREFASRLPVVIVPTKYYMTPTEVLRDYGFSLVIWANHLMRSALTSMQKTAAQIFQEESLVNVESRIVPVSEVFRIQGESELEQAEKLYRPAAEQKVTAVVLAASQGKELGELTCDRPKCVLPLGGKPIIRRITDTYRQSGIRRIAVVRGYEKQAIHLDEVDFFDNDAFAQTQEVGSLLAARPILEGPLVVSYGDVIFQAHVVQTLCSYDDDFILAVDPHWQASRNVQGRDADLICASRSYTRESFLVKTLLTDMPCISVEKAKLDRPAYPVDGEWIGVFKCSSRGTGKLLNLLDRLKTSGVLIEQLRVPDLFRALLTDGEEIRVVYTAGHWIDVDSVDDLYLNQSFE